MPNVPWSANKDMFPVLPPVICPPVRMVKAYGIGLFGSDSVHLSLPLASRIKSFCPTVLVSCMEPEFSTNMFAAFTVFAVKTPLGLVTWM